jgi:hypothetical protein
MTPSRLFACTAPLLLAGCVFDTEDAPTDTTTIALTNVIPTSKTCNEGTAPKQCFYAPVLEATSLSPWTVNGTRGESEYAGATEIPFTTDVARLGTVVMPPLRGHGRIHLRRVDHVRTGARTSYLYVYLEDILVTRTSPTQLASTLSVYIDDKRFDGATSDIAVEDRRYVINLAAGGTVRTDAPAFLNGTPVWMPTSTAIGTSYAPGGCVPSPDNTWATCKGELRIPLSSTAVAAPGTNLDPGVGFFVRSAMNQASAPALDADDYASSYTKRTTWPTVLFTTPKGFDLKVMSWNLRRLGALDTTDFTEVKPADLGKFLAKNDIVAIQEGWDAEEMEKILDGANAERTALGLPKFHLYGPVDYGNARSSVISEVISWATETQGGLWVMSHFNAGAKSYKIFDDCRGEDCFKAKGVQWVRLMLQDPETLDPECLKGVPKSCDKLPSGDDYVDIFNTHMQASEPLMCIFDDDWATEKTLILAALYAINPITAAIAAAVDTVIEVIESDLNCESATDAGVRHDQLVQMNAFISGVTGPDADRPSLVMGDFNIDGKYINDPLKGLEYRNMLVTLGIASASDPFSDAVSPFPDPFDVKHGDLVRELTHFDFGSGICLGTAIGTDDGWINHGCPEAGRSDGPQRLDYMLVRPPTRPEDVSGEYPRWYMQPGKQVWSSPFPSLSGQFAYEPPLRLSDHKPIVSSLELTRRVVPPPYNPSWPHDVELRVTAVDGTGYDDCIGCGEIDPYGKLRSKIHPNGTTTNRNPTSECTGIQSPSYPYDPCMNNWYLDRDHTPGTETAVDMRTTTHDDDNTSADDTLGWATRVQFVYDVGGAFPMAMFQLYETQPFVGTEVLDTAYPTVDNHYSQGCTGAALDVCYRVTATERPPGS